MYSKDHPQRDVTGLCSVKIGYLLNPVAALLSRSEPDVKGNRKCLFFHTEAGSSSSLPSLVSLKMHLIYLWHGSHASREGVIHGPL